MDAHLIDADGNVLPTLAQRDMFPPIRLVRPYETTIAELRGLLAPLLDDPYEMHDFEVGYDFGGDPLYRCRFCEVEPVWKRAWTGRLDKRGRKINEWVDKTPHKLLCPVLRRDELLGR